MKPDRLHTQAPHRRHVRGFTMIELMITVAIIAILAGLAVASYDASVTKSRRSAAAACLMERAQAMERYYTINLTYVGAPDPPACGPDISPDHYTVAFTAVPTATAFSLEAVPQGGQASKDGKCGTLTLDAQGTKGIDGGTADADYCW
ncbi:type IV pilin protein [Lysobacter sp. A3-1-A15]|uniref:type IV pilin protein n=1 Tax=Novilysobacter viscosus TaxID=3098602 RepID=UPI002ED8D8A2